jgi:hypothetical protein
MKLILSSRGGITGLQKTHSIDIEHLDDETRHSLQRYFAKSSSPIRKNYSETWKLENGTSASIDPERLDDRLRSLYENMRSQLNYRSLK